MSLSDGLIRVVPLLIYWNLWKERCRRRFKGVMRNSYALFLVILKSLRCQVFGMKPKRPDDAKGKEILKFLNVEMVCRVEVRGRWVK